MFYFRVQSFSCIYGMCPVFECVVSHAQVFVGRNHSKALSNYIIRPADVGVALRVPSHVDVHVPSRWGVLCFAHCDIYLPRAII